MAEHMIETRILLRYDTFSNWMNSTEILMEGEVAIAKIPYGTTITTSDHWPSNTPPAIGLKVGDGHSYFSELPWIQAVAGDVYNWAKQQTKPTYTANEIDGLDSYIQEHGGSGGGGSGGEPSTITARVYQIIQGVGNNANKYYLQYRTSDSNEWIVDTSHYIDLSDLSNLMNWVGDSINDYFTLGGYIFDTVSTELHKLNVSDNYEEGKVIVSIEQQNGKIITDKRALNLNSLSGPLSISLGGTGLTSISADNILVGTENNTFTTRTIETIFDDSNNLSTNHAIKQYVDTKTAGLTGAMHYIGEANIEINPAVNANVNPQIPGYDFSKAQIGDVVTQNYKEFVWVGGWRLLGDEGSYTIKGSIVDADISPEANISQSKIFNLVEDLANKVTIVEGKGLSTNDYTTIEKNKLAGIEDGAQVNAIEHIFVNDVERPIVNINGLSKSIALSIDVFDEEHATKLDGIQAGAQVNTIEHIFLNNTELTPTTVQNLAKSINLNLTLFTEVEKQKLANIESEAQVNKIEALTINGTNYLPNEHKTIEITLDQAALNLNVLEGATIPQLAGGREDVTQTQKKLELERIAVTGNVQDLRQTNDTYIILDCGSSTEVI